MLNRIDVLRVLNLGWKLKVTPQSTFTQSQLAEIIAPGSAPTLNRALRSFEFKRSNVIDEVGRDLQDPDIVEKVENGIGIRGILSTSELSDLFRLVNTSLRPAPATIVCNHLPPSGTSKEYLLSDEEKEAVGLLCAHLTQSGEFKTVWETNYNSGASTVAQALRYQPDIVHNYQRIFFLRPSDLDNPYQAELLAVAQELSTLQNSPRAFASFCSTLAETKTLLVFLGASALDSDFRRQSFLKQIVDDLSTEKGEFSVHDGLSHLLFVGNSDGTHKLEGKKDKVLARRLLGALSIKRRQREARCREVFEQQLKRYCKWRKLPENVDIGGSRMKRAFWHYSNGRRKFVDQNHWPEWPIGVKFRAFCYSNMENYSYSDPTNGLAILGSELENLPPDIAEYIADIQGYLNSLERSKEHRTKLSVLRRVSTGKYWLTYDRLMTLLKRKDSKEIERFVEEAAPTWNPLVRKSHVPSTTSNGNAIVLAPFAVRCVVQEQWRKKNRRERAIAHRQVAYELLDARHEAHKLAMDFPLADHWGDTGLFFVAEAIRHLVRSISVSEGVSEHNEQGHPKIAFPDEPAPASTGCDPNQTIDYCYKELYCRLLNEPDGLSDRALTKKAGAYHLAVELLQLLSHDGNIGDPHPALSTVYHRDFKRHCAFALVDIGRLKKANDIFEALAEVDTESATFASKIDDRINLAMVRTVLGDYEEAKGTVNECIELLNSYLADNDIQDVERRSIKQIVRRIHMRVAHLEYLNGEPEETLKILSGLTRDGTASANTQAVPSILDRNGRELAPLQRTRFEPEVTQLLIAASASSPTTFGNQEAFSVCLPNFLEASSKGLQHDAMGYKISLAHLLRKEKHLHRAELFLDSVNRDLLRFGSSERTFLAFLTEAGRLLLDTDRPVRAYASYLQTGLIRANSRSYFRELQTLKTLVEQAFHDMLELKVSMDQDAWSEYIDAELADQRIQNQYEEQNLGSGNARDPVFAFGIVDRSATIELCRTEKGISDAKLWLELLFA